MGEDYVDEQTDNCNSVSSCWSCGGGGVRLVRMFLQSTRQRSHGDPFKGRAIIANPALLARPPPKLPRCSCCGAMTSQAFLADMKDNNVKIATSNGSRGFRRIS
jgi:hypothetical protein